MQLFTGGLVNMVLGVALLAWGNRVRLFAAGAGFLAGYGLAPALVPGIAPLAAVLLAAAAAVAAVILVSIAAGAIDLILSILGAIAGAAVAVWFARLLGLNAVEAFAAVAGAVAGFLLMRNAFEFGITLLTSLVGASLVTAGIQTTLPAVSPALLPIINVALVVAGFLLQRRR